MSAAKKSTPYVFGTGAMRPPLPEAERPASEAAAPAAKSTKAPSRAGKRAITFYASDEAWAQLRTLSIREPGSSTQALMTEALNDLFSKRGLNRFD
jgi:hypothetical protein